MLAALEAELPATAASMRLSGLELSDCLGELGALGGDLTGGVRAAARMAAAAEKGVRAAPAVVTGSVLPAIARSESRARGALACVHCVALCVALCLSSSSLNKPQRQQLCVCESRCGFDVFPPSH